MGKHCQVFSLCHSHHTIACLLRLFAAYLSATHISAKAVPAKQSAPLFSGTAIWWLLCQDLQLCKSESLSSLALILSLIPHSQASSKCLSNSLCSQNVSWVDPLLSALLLTTPTPSTPCSANVLLPLNPMPPFECWVTWRRNVSFLLTVGPLLFLTLLSSKMMFIKFIEWSLRIRIYWSQLFELVEVLHYCEAVAVGLPY